MIIMALLQFIIIFITLVFCLWQCCSNHSLRKQIKLLKAAQPDNHDLVTGYSNTVNGTVTLTNATVSTLAQLKDSEPLLDKLKDSKSEGRGVLYQRKAPRAVGPVDQIKPVLEPVLHQTKPVLEPVNRTKPVPVGDDLPPDRLVGDQFRGVNGRPPVSHKPVVDQLRLDLLVCGLQDSKQTVDRVQRSSSTSRLSDLASKSPSIQAKLSRSDYLSGSGGGGILDEGLGPTPSSMSNLDNIVVSI